jgi:hypothetical protein
MDAAPAPVSPQRLPIPNHGAAWAVSARLSTPRDRASALPMRSSRLTPISRLGAAWLLALAIGPARPATPADPDPHRLAERNPPVLRAPPPLDDGTRRLAIERLLALLGRHHVAADRVAPPVLATWRERLLADALALPDEAFWQRLDQQLGALADSHTRLLSPAQALQRGREPHPGLRGRPQAEGSLHIDMVLPGSAAARAGVQPGWRLLRVDGEPWPVVWERARRVGRAESSARAEQ